MMEVDEEGQTAEQEADTPRLVAVPMMFRRLFDRSTGATNDSLVDHLKETGSVRSPVLEAAFRAIDRKKFLPEADESSSEVYDDAPVRVGHFHMSQPSLYADALVALELKPGLSFLNIGSGTGYLSSIVSEITGPALHHGVEIHKDLIEHASEMLREQGKDYIEFFQVNAHDLDLVMSPRYDRIYLGACAGGQAKQLLALLQVGGVLVGPFETAAGQYIRKVVRKSENRFDVKNLKQVSFGRLVPSDDPNRRPLFTLPSLPWTPESHASHSPGFKAALQEVLFCTTRPESPAHILPRDIFIKHVFGFVHPRWFSKAVEGPLVECVDGADEHAMEDEGSYDEEAARLQVLRTLAMFARQQRAREQEQGHRNAENLSLQQFFRLLRGAAAADDDDGGEEEEEEEEADAGTSGYAGQPGTAPDAGQVATEATPTTADVDTAGAEMPNSDARMAEEDAQAGETR